MSHRTSTIATISGYHLAEATAPSPLRVVISVGEGQVESSATSSCADGVRRGPHGISSRPLYARTWDVFRKNNAAVTAFRERHRGLARARVKQGDIFICYMTRLSRWCGALRVESDAYDDDSPIYGDPDPFTVRFRVKPIVVLEPEMSIPIYDDEVWSTLTLTNRYERGHSDWTGFFRGSLNKFEDGDGSYLVKLLQQQESEPTRYPLTDKDKRHLRRRTRVRTLDRDVDVEVPDDEERVDEIESDPAVGTDDRESIRVQAKVAQIGAEMGFRIWVPRPTGHE